MFEDEDYTGGSAQPMGASDHRITGARVELYTAGGSFLSAATTDVFGTYLLTAPAVGSYVVRVVSATAGEMTSAIPEQVSESDGAGFNGGVGALGGNDPYVDDLATPQGAGPGDTSVNVMVGANGLADVNLGFSYDVIIHTRDSGQGSLRQFLLNAAARPGTHLSLFMVPGADYLGLPQDPNHTGSEVTFDPLSPLPTLSNDQTRLNGTNQAALAGGLVVIRGAQVATGSCLSISGDSVNVQRLVLQACPDAVVMRGINGLLRDVDIKAPRGHGVVVGGTSQRVQGVTVSGAGGHGILADSGTGHEIVDSTIDASALDGIAVTGATTRVNIIHASTSMNTGLGIDLGDDGTTPNDPGDSDTGPNDFINTPLLQGAYLVDNQLHVSGESRVGAALQFFVADGAAGEPGQALGWLETVAEGDAADLRAAPGADTGTGAFAFIIPDTSLRTPLVTGNTLTATATRNGGTSELAANVVVESWWNASWPYRAQMQLTAGSALSAGMVVDVQLAHSALVGGGFSLANGADVRIVDHGTVPPTELDRVEDTVNGWNLPGTTLWFRLPRALGAGRTEDQLYVYYGNASAPAAPGSLEGVFDVGDSFSGGGLVAGLDTSVSGTVNISETGGSLVMDSDTMDGSAAIVRLSPALPSDRLFVARHKVRATALGGPGNPETKLLALVESAQVPTVLINTSENPRRRVIVFHRTDGALLMFYVGAGGGFVYWTGSAWTTTSTAFGNFTVGTEFIVEVHGTGNSFFLRLRNSTGTPLTTTTSVPWSSLQSATNLWLYWGEVYNSHYWADMSSDYFHYHRSVTTRPTVTLGPQQSLD